MTFALIAPSSSRSQIIKIEFHISSVPLRWMACEILTDTDSVLTCNSPCGLAMHRTSYLRSSTGRPRSCYQRCYTQTKVQKAIFCGAHFTPDFVLMNLSPWSRTVCKITSPSILAGVPQTMIAIASKKVQNSTFPFVRSKIWRFPDR